jgi:hypothetical protein
LLSLFLLSRRQFPIYLSLLAILMLFLAPVISKSLEHQRASQPCSAAITSTHNNMPDMAAMHHAMPGMEHDLHSSLGSACAIDQGMSHHLVSTPGSSPMEDIACGYCQLLIHLPLIQTVFIPFIWLIRLVSQAPFLPVIVAPLLSACYSEYQPRAPPSLFSLH